jgi:hypothetical protein
LQVDHRTGKPLEKIPDYVTNKKKKKVNAELTFPKIQQDKPLPTEELNDQHHELTNYDVITHDDEFPLPSTSGLIERDFRLDDDGDGAIQSYDSMSILMDIDQEFSDFQLLSPNASCHENNEDDIDQQFSIIDTTGEATLKVLIIGKVKLTKKLFLQIFNFLAVKTQLMLFSS